MKAIVLQYGECYARNPKHIFGMDNPRAVVPSCAYSVYIKNHAFWSDIKNNVYRAMFEQLAKDINRRPGMLSVD